MNYVYVPLDLTKFTTKQQDEMFMAWLRLVANELKARSIQALFLIEDKGIVGPSTTKNIQKALAWIGVYPVQVLVPFNDFFANDVPNQSHPDVRRNDPAWYADSLLSRAGELSADYAKGVLGVYEVIPRPRNGTIEV